MNEPNKKAGIELDEMVHAPARLLILTILSVTGSVDFTFLQKQSQLTRGNLSSHLRKLEDAGYVKVTKEFVERIPRTLIRISDTGFEAYNQYREDMKRLLDD
ncbi:transcriptional regulator [bacterium]|nr:transcriptional regulator [bacterium]